MVNKKISQLAAATGVAPGDVVPVVQGGVTKQVDPDVAVSSLLGNPASATAASLSTTYVQFDGTHLTLAGQVIPISGGGGGTSIVDNGDGTLSSTSSSIVDNGDGTLSAA